MKKQGTPGFIGDRLKLACELRNISHSGLASILDISKQIISQYINGEKTPSSQIFTLISDKLNLPKNFFLEPIKTKELNPIFFRSLSYTTKTQRINAKSKYILLKDIYYFINNYVESQLVKIPEFDIKNIYSLNDVDIEKFALEARMFWELKLGPISNVVQLLENIGIIISGFEMDSTGLDAFSEWDSITKHPFIILNLDEANNKAVRLRFNTAHELGHLLLHKDIDPNEFNNKAKFKTIENQAMKFASAFLLPEESFKKEVRWISLDYFVELKKRWKVSLQAMVMRSYQLGLITDRQQENLFININRKGWRKSEPLDNILEIEKPVFLYKAIDLMLNEVLTRDEFIHSVSLPAGVIEEVAYLPKNFMRNTEILDFNLKIKKKNFTISKKKDDMI